MNTYPIRSIRINGAERKALFSLFLWQRLDEEGLSVSLRGSKGGKTAELAATADLVTIIYGALRNAIYFGVEQPYELTLLDVDCWATANRKEFAEVITFALRVLVPPKDPNAPTPQPDEEEPAKKKPSRSMLAKLRRFLSGTAE
jgi:hypothetical protein